MATQGTNQPPEVWVCSMAVHGALCEAFQLGESTKAADKERAISIYRDVTQRDPQCDVGWFNLAVVESRTGRNDGAIDSFERAQRFPRFRAAAALALLNLLAQRHGIRNVASFERIVEPRLPEEFRGAQGSVLGVHGRCHNAANVLRNRGYACRVHGEGLSCSINVTTKRGDYVIQLRDMANTLLMSVHRTENNKTALLTAAGLNPVERELYYLDIAALPTAQAPIPPTAPAVGKQQEPPGELRAGWRSARGWRKTSPSFLEARYQASTADIAKNLLSPERLFTCVLGGEPRAVGMAQVLPDEMPILKQAVDSGACVVRAQLFAMPAYPIVHIGLSVPVRLLPNGSFAAVIMESVTNFGQGNLQEWVAAVEAKGYTVVDLYAADCRHLATGRTTLTTNVTDEIVRAMEQANALLADRDPTRVDHDFARAVDEFYASHPAPFLWKDQPGAGQDVGEAAKVAEPRGAQTSPAAHSPSPSPAASERLKTTKWWQFWR
jgi:tetratricopeptide (TPR) repeat protein